MNKEEASSCETWEIPSVHDLDSKSNNSNSVNPRYTTAEQLERVQKEAYDEAFQEGLIKGLEAGQVQIAEKAKHFEAIINSLAEPIHLMDEEVQQELVNLCIALLKQLVRRELKLDPGQVVAVVRDSLSALPLSSRNIQIRLNPEDVKLVQEALGTQTESSSWTIVEDPVVSCGSCKVLTETSRIDATIESRIAQLITQVFGGDRESDKNSR